MSQRYQSGRVSYKIDNIRQKIKVIFDDRFGCKFLDAISLKQFFTPHLVEKYKYRKKHGNTLQMKLKEQQISDNNEKDSKKSSTALRQNQHKMSHSALFSWLQQVLDMQYYYFKSLPKDTHLSRNKRFQKICSEEAFRQLYPEIRCMILIQSQNGVKQKNGETIHKLLFQQQQQEKFKNGELIVFIQREKKHSIKQIVKYLETYTRESVVYSLDEYCGMPALKKEELSLNEIRTILEKVVEWLTPEIKAMAKQIRLLIKNISIYAPDHKRERYADFEGRLGLDICIEGMFRSLPQFYFCLQSLFKRHPLTIGKVQNIEFAVNSKEMQESYKKEGIMLFFGSYQSVGIINLNKSFTNWVEFKRSLRKGLHIISELKGFTHEQIEILIREHRQVENFINDEFMDFVSYEYKPINEKSFFIHCEKQNVDKFVARAFDYLKKNYRVQTRRQQFTTQFQLFLFKKLIQTHIEQKYPTVSFFIKDGLLYSRSKEQDLEDLKIEMLNERRKMLKKIVRLPCVRQLKNSHLYQIIDDEFQNEKFCHQNNIKIIHYLFNENQNIYLRGLSSISECHELLIPIIDQYYEEFQFFMSKFQQNSLSLQKYQKHLQGQNQGKPKMDRMILYSMTKSKYVNGMLVWFVDQDRRGFIDSKRLKWDLVDFIEKQKHNHTLEFVIPQSMWTNQHYFGQFFTLLLMQLKQQSQTSKTTTINIFYEESSSSSSHNQLLQRVRRVFEKSPSKEYFQFKSEMRLSSLEIQKILLTEGWAATFWDNDNQKNGTLSVLNSFVFAYEKSRRKDEFKVPLILRSKETINTSQFLLSLKQGIYYKLSSNYQITKYQIGQNREISKFAAIIKKYFTFLEYFVVYMNDQETEIEAKKMYFWLSTPTSALNNSKTISGQQKIKRFEINQEGKLIPKKNSEVDIFVKKVDVIPKYIIETHVDFLSEVKKIMFANFNKATSQK